MASVTQHGWTGRICDIVLLFQDQTRIADTWRVLHSMAGQIEYVIRMMEVLQDIVLTDLQSQSVSGSRQGSKTQQRKVSL